LTVKPQQPPAALAPDQRHMTGPFDLIGDVHGCADELIELLQKLGYRVDIDTQQTVKAIEPPEGRKVIFVGDFVDRGPNSVLVLKIVMHLCDTGNGFAVIGNHDDKFWRWLQGRKVTLSHGLEKTVKQIEPEPLPFRAKVQSFLSQLPAHLWLARGELVVAHAGIKSHMIGEVSDRIRRFCLYGDTSGERDENGLPVRYHWAAEYDGKATIIYGHTPVSEAQWVRNTLCIDTGCCFGGKLTALRWPERQTVSVESSGIYARRVKPFGHPPVRPELTLP
jgi:predicted phosphodiesterase